MQIKLVDAAKMFTNAKTTAADAAALLAHCKKHKKPDFGRLAEAVDAKDTALIKALATGGRKKFHALRNERRKAEEAKAPAKPKAETPKKSKAPKLTTQTAAKAIAALVASGDVDSPQMDALVAFIERS